MRTHRFDNLQLVVTHLNASVGKVVSIESLAQSLLEGSLANIKNKTAAAMIASLFVEASPEMIVACAREAGANIESVNNLYLETVAGNIGSSSAWEDALEWLL